MGVFKLISKWNRVSETFQAQQYILNWAKEEDLVKILVKLPNELSLSDNQRLEAYLPWAENVKLHCK